MKLEANKMEILIEDLMTLSRIEQQEHISINNKVNIKKIIEDVIILTSKRVKDKQIWPNKIQLRENLHSSSKFISMLGIGISSRNPIQTMQIKRRISKHSIR